MADECRHRSSIGSGGYAGGMSVREPACFAPRHWPALLALGILWLLARVPYRLLLGIGTLLGRLIVLAPGRRAAVARRNLELCFPELEPAARERLLRAHLGDLGRMLVEFALAWMGSERALDRVPVTIVGLEHLEAARAAGRGVLLVGAHMSHLELAGRLLTRVVPVAGMYREHADPCFEAGIRRARSRYAEAMYTRHELKAAIRHLRRGGVLWYAPDQDYRRGEHVFVPFFGVPAASITATHHLAKLTGAWVIGFQHRRLPAGGYRIELHAPLADFPSADPVLDTARVNGLLELMVRAAPEQYLWVHRRFKRRPPGSAPVY